jgi:hypothetical protein
MQLEQKNKIENELKAVNELLKMEITKQNEEVAWMHGEIQRLESEVDHLRNSSDAVAIISGLEVQLKVGEEKRKRSGREKEEKIEE